MNTKQMDEGDDALCASVIQQVVEWVAKARPDLTPQQHLKQASRLLLGMSEMAAKVVGLQADISRLSAEVAGLRGQVKACHELLDKKDITIRNMETDKRVAQERTSAIYVETVRRLEGERDGLRKYVEFMAAKSCSGWLTCETHGFQVEACCNSCRARRALSTPTGTAARERPIEWLSGCPNCGEEPEEWSSMSEFDCAGCGKTLTTEVREDEAGKHWSFPLAFDAPKPGGGLPVTGEGAP